MNPFSNFMAGACVILLSFLLIPSYAQGQSGIVIPRGHSHTITGIALHNDYLLTAGKDGVVKVWDIWTGQLQFTSPAFEHEITGIDVKKNGKVLVSTADKARWYSRPEALRQNVHQTDNELPVFERAVWSNISDGIMVPAFEKNQMVIGRMLLGKPNLPLDTFDVRRNFNVIDFDLGTVNKGVFIGQQPPLDAGYLQLLDASEEPVKFSRNFTEKPRKVAMYPAEELIAVALGDKVLIMSYGKPKPDVVIQRPGGFYDLHFDLSFQSRGPGNPQDYNKATLLATGSPDWKIHLWDFNTGKLIHEFVETHSAPVKQLCFNPEGNIMASLSENGEVIIWSVTLKKMIRRIAPEIMNPMVMAYDQVHHRLAIGMQDLQEAGTPKFRTANDPTGSGRIALWHFEDGKYESIPVDYLPVGLHISTEGAKVFAASDKGEIFRYHAPRAEADLRFQSGFTDVDRMEIKYLADQDQIVLLKGQQQEIWQVAEPGPPKKLSNTDRSGTSSNLFSRGQLRNTDDQTPARTYYLPRTIDRPPVKQSSATDNNSAANGNTSGRRIKPPPGVEIPTFDQSAVAGVFREYGPEKRPSGSVVVRPTITSFSPSGNLMAKFIDRIDPQTGATGSQSNRYSLQVTDGQGTGIFTQENFSDAAIALFWATESQLLLGMEDGRVEMWNVQGNNLSKALSLFSLGATDYIYYTNDYYFGSKNAVKRLAYRSGNQLEPIAHFDLAKNRPDKVLEALGFADPALVALLAAAHEKRLKLHGLHASQVEAATTYSAKAPNLRFLSGSENKRVVYEPRTEVRIKMNTRSKNVNMERLFVYVNGVPLFGIGGKPLHSDKKQPREDIDIPLSEGNNEIQAFGLSSEGQLSQRASINIYYLKNGASPPPDLYIAAIGISEFDQSDFNLDYAHKDAADLLTQFKEARFYRSIKPILIQNQALDSLDLLRLKKHFSQAGVEDQVMLFFSSHGLIGPDGGYFLATRNTDFENPALGSVSFRKLEGVLDGIACRQKLLLVDACHSGEIDPDARIMAPANPAVKVKSFKGKGGSVQLGTQNTMEMVRFLFNELRMDTGTSIISSSSGAQFSYENTDYQNGAFTYVLLEALRNKKADINQDGALTVSEWQAYVEKFVPLLTEGRQVPTFRRENLENDFRVW